MEKKAVFDFDKTLVTINTFPLWIVFVIAYSVYNIDFKSSFVRLLWKRKVMKSITHDQFKKELLKIDLHQNYHRVFSKILINFRNKNCEKRLIQLIDSGYMIAVSSAAPEHYLRETINRLFPNKRLVIIGANCIENCFSGNYKEGKVTNLIRNRFISDTEEIEYLYTDSFDDYALSLRAKKLILVSPDKKSYQKFRELYINEIEII